MKKTISIVSFIAAMAVLGTAAYAQTNDSASFICRQARSGEQATAKMMGSSETLLVCRSVPPVNKSTLKNIGTVTVQGPRVMMFPYYATKQQLQDPALWGAFWARFSAPSGD